jgi:ferredoxin-nitrate reductase
MHLEFDHRAKTGEAICPYCGVGCRLWGEAAYGQVLRVKGCPDAPANLGGICAKGATLPQTLHAPDRLLQPHVRSRKSGQLQPTTWDKAIKQAASQLREIVAQHGPDAIAFYGSGQLDSETVYLVGKLFKGCLGTNNTDSNSRLCMATSVAAYRAALGCDAPPCCYDDIELADTLLVIGSNMSDAHPVSFDRLLASRKQRGDQRLIVVDPRRTRTAEQADLHVPIAPGGDIALLNLVSRRLLLEGAIDLTFIGEHTRGFEEYCVLLEALDERSALASCGIDAALLAYLVDMLSGAGALLSFYCMGLGQSTVGMSKINSLINLHLLTGQIGKPGAGPFSLTGQPNAMGGREGGLLAHQLPGYRFVEEAQHRREVEAYWRRPAGSISPRAGLTAVEMFRALETGKLKAIWIAATNPLVSLPDLHQVRRALARAELVIVQDVYHPTETTQLAHVLLPAANWGEKEWTSTNSERMVSFSERLLTPPGAARPDWEIVAAMGRELGFAGFEFAERDDVWDEFIPLTAGRPCDMSGMTAQRLRAVKGLQWPCPDLEHAGTKRRYLEKHFATPDGKAAFVPRAHREPRETVDHEFPLVLTTGRLYAHWHSLTRTGKSAKLVRRDPAAFVEIHPTDAARLGIFDGAMVQLSSRRGTIRLPARISDAAQAGLVFVPFHWGDQSSEQTAANYLTISAIGRVAKQPEFKYCAVAAEPVVPARQDIAEMGIAHVHHGDTEAQSDLGARQSPAIHAAICEYEHPSSAGVFDEGQTRSG